VRKDKQFKIDNSFNQFLEIPIFSTIYHNTRLKELYLPIYHINSYMTSKVTEWLAQLTLFSDNSAESVEDGGSILDDDKSNNNVPHMVKNS
jgi:hypothetical protein